MKVYRCQKCCRQWNLKDSLEMHKCWDYDYSGTDKILETAKGAYNKMGIDSAMAELGNYGHFNKKSCQDRMSDDEFERWIKGFQSDFSLRQKEVVAKLAFLRTGQTLKGEKVVKIKLRRED